MPFVERPEHKPLYRHRPEMQTNISNQDFCSMLDILYLKYSSTADLHTHLRLWNYDYILIGGANILDKSITDNFKIINAHPGYLPYSRGLDALKWAFYNEHPIGVTTHFIDENPDAGYIIEKAMVPIYRNDSFHSIAYRQYHMEINMLARSVGSVLNTKMPVEQRYKPNMRMPVRDEIIMMDRCIKRINNSNEFK